MKKQVFRIFSIFLLVMMLTSCKTETSHSIFVPDSDPLYKLKVLEDVPNTQLIDVYLDLTLGYYKFIYPDMQYAHFIYSGNLDEIEAMKGSMTIQYTAVEKNGVISSPVLLSAVFDPATRVVYFYKDDLGNEKTAAEGVTLTPISSTRFQQLSEKLTGYFEQVNITDGYVEITENVVDGEWIVLHYPSQNGSADAKFRINGDTFELLEYDMHP